jgi:hypothetical protein
LIDNSSIILMEMTKSLGKKCSEKKKIWKMIRINKNKVGKKILGKKEIVGK